MAGVTQGPQAFRFHEEIVLEVSTNAHRDPRSLSAPRVAARDVVSVRVEGDGRLDAVHYCS
jgi:hypothetical protein